MEKEIKKISFAQWLEDTYGLSWGYVDNNYSGEQYEELWNEYQSEINPE
jgi:hypothetical protein